VATGSGTFRKCGSIGSLSLVVSLKSGREDRLALIITLMVLVEIMVLMFDTAVQCWTSVVEVDTMTRTMMETRL
jgi:hypothetical protein